MRLRRIPWQIILLIFLMAYVATYLLSVQRVYVISREYRGIVAEYPFGGEVSKLLFSPLHRIDTAVRSFYWSKEGWRAE